MKTLSTTWQTIRTRPRTLITGPLLALCALGLGACGDPSTTAETPAEAPPQRPAGSPDDESAQPPIEKFSEADLSRLAGGSTDAQTMMGSPSTAAEPRSFRRLSADDEADLEELIKRFRAATDVGARIEILEEMEQYYGDAILEVITEVLAKSSEELRFYAVGLLKGNVSAQILDTLRPALEDESTFVRSAALEAVTQVESPAVVDFLARGFADPEVAVRHAALIATDDLVDQNRYDALARAMESPHADIVGLAIRELQVDGTRQALETLFPVIDSPNPGTRKAARHAVVWLIDEDFETTAAAQAWWAEHRGEFDRDLVRKTE